MREARRGATLIELLMGVAVLGAVFAGIAGLLKYTGVAVSRAQQAGMAQEESRQALMIVEEVLAYANEIQVASATYVHFTLDLEHAADYVRDGDMDGDGVPNFRDGDRDADINQVLSAADAWRGGYNLEDDDEDGDLQIDLEGRLYLSGRDLRYETRRNGGGWSGKVLLEEVRTATFTYWGNRANPLGSQIDLGNDGVSATGDAGENDGVISSAEMDMAPSPAGMGNRSGTLDLANERRYITSARLAFAVDRNRDGKNDYAIETDVYPPLLPLKSR